MATSVVIPITELYWLSNKYMTVGVYVNAYNTIISTPPIVQAFKGQDIANLVRWMKKMDRASFKIEKVK
jgi:hypothetical protein